MESDLLDLYDRASAWTVSKVTGATTQLDAPTPCDEWDVRTLMNHMLDTANYFVGAARGDHARRRRVMQLPNDFDLAAELVRRGRRLPAEGDVGGHVVSRDRRPEYWRRLVPTRRHSCDVRRQHARAR